MNTVWESADEQTKVLESVDRFTVVHWANGRQNLIAEYWKDFSAQEALVFAIEEARTVSRTLLG